LTKNNARWTWTEKEQQKFEELKEKIKNIGYLGVPRSSGEIVMVTDASNIGGGATLFQWQKLTKDQVPEDLKTQGVNGDGKLKHNYPEEFFLVPLGHWNWKCNSTRRNYDTYEQELMAGVLTLASQKRIVSHLPIIWFTDQQPLKEFLKKDPPLKARLLRWYAFLSQLRLNIQHIPGLKNELCDYLSRNNFQEKFQVDLEDLAKDAFQKMDAQLDLRMEVLTLEVQKEDLQRDFEEIWNTLEPFKAKMIEGQQWYRTEDSLYCERKRVIPHDLIKNAIQWCHENNGHPGISRTAWFFLSMFHCSLPRKELLDMIKKIMLPCQVCAEAKPSCLADRGMMGALPIPQIANDTLYIDFIQTDPYNNFDYIMTIVDSLTRFCMFLPCRKTITGEVALKMIFF